MTSIIYNSGDVFLPTPVKKLLATDLIGSSQRTFYISGWSIMHFLSGLICGILYNRAGILRPEKYYLNLFIIHSLWELWQVVIGMSHPLKLIGRSNLVDIILDTVFFMFGAYLAKS